MRLTYRTNMPIPMLTSNRQYGYIKAANGDRYIFIKGFQLVLKKS
jgi:hypothetical protein